MNHLNTLHAKLSFQQKLALKRQYSKLKKRQSQLLQYYRLVPKPMVSQQDANSQLVRATQHFNRANRGKKIPSNQDDLHVKKAAENVIKWNLYNLYLTKIDRFLITEIDEEYTCDKFFNLNYVQTNFKNVKEIVKYKDPINYTIKEYTL